MSRAIEHRYAEVNGVRLHYASAGRGPLMLFVHGFPEFWGAWREQLEEFSRDFQAVAVDLRGFNLSGKPEGVKAYHARHVVEDLRQLVLHLGHERAIVVAHDWGGAMAWNLAAFHPEVVARLVSINSPHPVPLARELRRNPAQQKASEYMQLFRSDKAERVLSENGYARLAGLLADWSAAAHAPDAQRLAEYRAAWSQPGALTGGLNYYRASPLFPPADGRAPPELDAKLFTVRVPTLVIWGERDQALLPCLLDGLDECVTDLRIERIAEGSHWVVHELPDRVNALIRAFVR
ncbi:MAG TPA: alpha/beta hydrolase [Candidatus Binatia bacterium]|nr:alpha/beta hydrolase [Candidatus Binatia bacterium]